AMKKLLATAFLLSALISQAQVKIGNNPSTIDANSLLELEATDKGFLAPRVTLTSLTSVSPLTGTVPAGMLIYNSAGSLAYGYYYWDGSGWKQLTNGQLNCAVKTANATLTKTEHFVLASNDITITLPSITSADDGMVITVKNNGTYMDLVVVKPGGSSTIDGYDSTNLTRNIAKIFVAYNSNWYVRSALNTQEEHVLEVDETGSWATLQEAIEFLGDHMSAPSVIRLGNDVDVTETITIDLPYSLTIQGLSYGSSTIQAAAGLTGSPMFRCLSECYFKMLAFDGSTLGSYGTVAGEDAIRFLASGSYNEVKDCSFDTFYNTLLDSTDAELWVFETDINNSAGSGILIHSAEDSVTVKVAETDFIGCNYGVNLSKADEATIQLASGGYYNGASGDTAIYYNATDFTNFLTMSITGNSWNNTGVYISGFDFTRIDARDANIIIEGNAGMGDKSPNCHIKVVNSATTTTLTTANTWYKANWNYSVSSYTTVKFRIRNASGGIDSVNRIIYQPTNRRDGYFVISGNLSVNNASRTISLAIVKNGSTGTRYGETTLRTGSAATASQFTSVVYLSDIGPNDYFEIYITSTSSSDIVTMLDVLWLAQTR
ncbi:MAG TPA: hypothetical protein VN451_07870, partial [Chitinophagaceae bacterium]|nr:hypothetical protein [Chitinophagaceae bacterium]